MKSKLLKHIDEFEQKLITKLTSIKEKNETKINKEKDEMSRLVSCLKDEKQELEFHKNYSTNNQLEILIFFKLHVNVLNSILHLLDLGVRLLDVCYLFT
jgi:hypothetical protein